MAFTVKQLADLAGISCRTLRYYDEIGLLKSTSYGANSYRYYSDESLLQLQQILFYRELGFTLREIQRIVGQSDYDVVLALQSQREALLARVSRLHNLIETIDKTILHVKGEVAMSTEDYFDGFTEEKQKAYEQEARQQYGDEIVGPSVQLWESYSPQRKEEIKAEGQAIYLELRDLMDQGPESQAVQQVIARWHQHLRYFYEPTPGMLRGLGQMYTTEPRFVALYQAMHPDLPEFLRQSIDVYCRNLAQAG